MLKYAVLLICKTGTKLSLSQYDQEWKHIDIFTSMLHNNIKIPPRVIVRGWILKLWPWAMAWFHYKDAGLLVYRLRTSYLFDGNSHTATNFLLVIRYGHLYHVVTVHIMCDRSLSPDRLVPSYIMDTEYMYIFIAIIGYDVIVHNKVGPEPELNK